MAQAPRWVVRQPQEGVPRSDGRRYGRRMPEPQQGALRWVVLALIAAAFIALAIAGTDDRDDHSTHVPWMPAGSLTDV